MYRIRFHGRGGQGIKTASRILGTAFFLQGYEVQDAPRYGAERRGAPVSAYVRASKKKINERGIIRTPDLVVISDDSLFGVCPAILTDGVTSHTIVLVNTAPGSELQRTGTSPGKIITMPQGKTGYTAVHGTLFAAASASLAGVISRQNLVSAIREELSSLDPDAVESDVQNALDVFDTMNGYGVISESGDIPAGTFGRAGWIDPELHDSSVSVPAVHKPRTGALNLTGSWRTERPSINPGACSRCMLCALYCPDSVITGDTSGLPVIDYTHCKGCMICATVCPAHAIGRIPEHSATENKQ